MVILYWIGTLETSSTSSVEHTACNVNRQNSIWSATPQKIFACWTRWHCQDLFEDDAVFYIVHEAVYQHDISAQTIIVRTCILPDVLSIMFYGFLLHQIWHSWEIWRKWWISNLLWCTRKCLHSLSKKKFYLTKLPYQMWGHLASRWMLIPR